LANEGLEEKVKRRSEKLMKTVRQLEKEIERRSQVEQELTRRADQLRALAGELTMAEQRERKRLSNILHDHVQQILAATKLQVGSLHETSHDNFHQTIDQIDSLLTDAIHISRSLSAELSPPILHEGGLKPGLNWLARWMLQKHGLTVDIDSQKEYFPLAEDVRVLLFEAIRELLFNAVKHSGVHTAKVSIVDDGTFLKVTVTDDGHGFDPDNQIGPGEEGAGFGLFSIRERIELIRGEFAIDSALGKGSCFTITAPLKSSATAPQAAINVSPCREMPAEAAHDKIRLLLADDHAVMREGLARLLGQEPDIQIVGEASDGLEAVKLAEQLLPDVVLMDFSMPGLNGMEATKAIKRRHPQIQVIGLSVYDQEERAKEMLDAGAVNYLNKSGPATAVKAAIRACKMGLPKIAT
jgi:CheY-like chemotaxis protein